MHWRSLGAFSIFALLTAIAVARIVTTYGVLSHTYDEPAHIAAGMQLLVERTYDYEPLHPPFARMMTAILPWMDGAIFRHDSDMYTEGNAILHARNNYDRELMLARLGVIPFFVLGTLFVWVWSRTVHGNLAALFAVLLYTNVQVVLAHAGVATTDMIMSSILIVTLFAWIRWLQRPTSFRGLILGAIAGLAIISKFSALVFLAMCGSVIAACYWYVSGNKISLRSRTKSVLIAAGTVLVVIWIGYGAQAFQLTTRADRPHTVLDERIDLPPPLRAVAYTILELPIPCAPGFIDGLKAVVSQNERGHYSYLLGESKTTTDWRFFPVGLLFKSPLPFLALAFLGVAFMIRGGRYRADWRIPLPPLAAIVLLAVCLPTRINIGLRHVLPIFPLLAITGGYGAAALWNTPGNDRTGRGSNSGKRVLVTVLLLWLVIGSARAHPDYLSYFNELAGSHPERILVNSDLDWGQDLHRLRDACKERGIDELTLAYFGRADLTKHDLPATLHELEPNTPASGWVAASICSIKSKGGGGYRWLEEHEPAARIGQTILLYRFDELTGPAAGRDAAE